MQTAPKRQKRSLKSQKNRTCLLCGAIIAALAAIVAVCWAFAPVPIAGAMTGFAGFLFLWLTILAVSWMRYSRRFYALARDNAFPTVTLGENLNICFFASSPQDVAAYLKASEELSPLPARHTREEWLAYGRARDEIRKTTLKGEKTVKDVDGNESTVQISPSGKLADTYAYDWQSNNPVMNNLKYEGYSGISKMSVRYAEGIYMGYRWYETADAEGVFDGVSNDYGSGYDAVVQYPFGYGMSYTTFEWTVTQTPVNTMLEETGEYTVKVIVKNTGEHAGSDVVELYYTPPYTDGSIEKAHRNLLDFAKTGVLQPGETEEVTLSFSAYDMASFDDYSRSDNGWFGYELEEGDYILELMTDAHTVATVDGAQIANGRMVLEAAEDVLFLVDPDNPDSDVVLTRFTGEDAYAGVPIDGSTVLNGATYLSREAVAPFTPLPFIFPEKTALRTSRR